jgi:hypothetical protein
MAMTTLPNKAGVKAERPDLDAVFIVGQGSAQQSRACGGAGLREREERLNARVGGVQCLDRLVIQKQADRRSR